MFLYDYVHKIESLEMYILKIENEENSCRFNIGIEDRINSYSISYRQEQDQQTSQFS
jgi:hypothetical protein